jgi:hypothetical protein
MNAAIILTNKSQIRSLKNKIQFLARKYQIIEAWALTDEVFITQEDKKYLSQFRIKLHSLNEIEQEKQIKELSFSSTEIINQSIEQISANPLFKKIIYYHGVNLLKATNNDIYTYHLRDFLLFIERLRCLIKKVKPDVVLTFGNKGLEFASPERPAIDFLYDNEATFLFITRLVCQMLSVNLIILPRFNLRFVRIKLAVRSFILTLIKLILTFWRHLEAGLSSLEITKQGNGKIGIIIRGASEYYTVRPVIEKIRQVSKLTPVILQGDIFRNPSAKKTLDLHKEKYLPIYSFLNLLSVVKFWLQGKILQMKFLKQLKRAKIDTLPSQNLYQKILSNEQIIKEVFKSMSFVWPESLIFIEEFELFIKTYKPKLIVTMSMVDHWVAIEKYICDNFNLPLITLQNALMQVQSMPCQIWADKICVYGQKVKEGLIQSGEPAEKIIVTGAPQYDCYFAMKNQPEFTKFKKRLGLPLDKKIIIITTEALDYRRRERTEELIMGVLNSVKERQDVFCIIKLHPRETINEYSQVLNIIKKQKLKAMLVKDVDVLKLIAVSNLLVSRYSTTILSALIIGTPPISLYDSDASTIEADFLKTEATIKATNPSQLKRIIYHILDDENYLSLFLSRRQQFLENSIGIFDGKAAERVIKAISLHLDKK